jgi:ribonuclease HI
MGKQKFYVVWKGRQPGVFNTWEACSANVTGFTGAEYKSFDNLAAAEAAFRGAYSQFAGKPASAGQWKMALTRPQLPSISVDAACAGVPGPVEWRGVETESGKPLFKFGPFAQGTNNVGEFLAIVDGLKWLTEKQHPWPVYSDSENALLWVKARKCRTKLDRNSQNAQLFALIAQAETWLAENRLTNKLLKWDTEMWGENPADFGRK